MAVTYHSRSAHRSRGRNEVGSSFQQVLSRITDPVVLQLTLTAREDSTFVYRILTVVLAARLS